MPYQKPDEGEFISGELVSIEPAGTTEIKPGLKTTEFYVPTMTAALGLLVSLGLLTTPLADDVTTAIAAAVPAVVGLIGAVQAAAAYIKGRTSLKTAVALKK